MRAVEVNSSRILLCPNFSLVFCEVRLARSAARSSHMGFSVFLARSLLLVYSSAVARSKGMGFSYLLARSPLLGFSQDMAR
jgi:hypothetical protein